MLYQHHVLTPQADIKLLQLYIIAFRKSCLLFDVNSWLFRNEMASIDRGHLLGKALWCAFHICRARRLELLPSSCNFIPSFKTLAPDCSGYKRK
ncbi:hypothetical protein PILCRDRAFT_163964 [Piloderma croceum F 1598]|uniref:Uncharacterized protein n=1 Tax=Piloderma croceum (strain F 1598) TaxID=765440 RepID=A0A0C3G4E9_PILCF|nr:hypothetical protein PILCRDRAFT_163964 [Piloderma croceum F 1598]